MNHICIVPIGSIDREVLAHINSDLSRYIRVQARSVAGIRIPQNTFNDRRGQYRSTEILELLQSVKHSCYRVLGIIDRDLYVPELNFVFGEAGIFSGVAIISLTRLRQEFYGFPADRPLFFKRALKEAIHELGHTFQLRHCPGSSCIMHFSNSIRDTDIKGPDFCSSCQKKLNGKVFHETGS